MKEKDQIFNEAVEVKGPEQKTLKRRKRIAISVIAVSVLIIIIILLLLLRSCGSQPGPGPGPVITEPPIGSFDTVESTTSKTEPPMLDVPMITFVGRRDYIVSPEEPDIVLRNSEKNIEWQSDFVFTIIDDKSGEIVARTTKIAAGENVAIKMTDFYTKPGTYNITINIAVTDANGYAMNGMDQKARLTVMPKQETEATTDVSVP